MKFLPLIEVQLLHDYSLNGRCTDFAIEPTLATQQLLNNYRCIMKATISGFRLFATANDAGVPLISWPNDLTFIFQLRLRNPDFALFTDLAEIAQIADPIYTNADMPHGNPVQLALRARQTKSQRATGVFADIELHFNAAPPDAAGAAVVFQVQFGAKQAHWTYYVITDMNTGQVHVEDRATAPLQFSDANRTNLNTQPDRSDAIASTLAEHYPQMQRLRFVSDELILCQEAVRKTIQLRSDTNQLGGALPNPSFRNYTTVQIVENGNTHTQAALFHVLTYINRQSQTPGG